MRAGLGAAGAPAVVDAVFSGDGYYAKLAKWFGATGVKWIGPGAVPRCVAISRASGASWRRRLARA